MIVADRRSRKTGQAALELCIFLVLAIVAILVMALPVKGAILGRWRSVGNTFGHGLQYEPPCLSNGSVRSVNPNRTIVKRCPPGSINADGTCAQFDEAEVTPSCS